MEQAAGVLFGLASALCWGSGDFSGGLASRRASVYGVVLVAHAAGLVPLVLLALGLAEPMPSIRDLLWSGAAGVAGTVGLLAFYRALAVGRMGIGAPVSGVISAGLPVLAGFLAEGAPAPRQMVGFMLAFVAVWLLSPAHGGFQARARALGLPVLAGLGFGAFLIVIGRVSRDSVLWPLVASRSVSMALLALAVLWLRRTRDLSVGRPWLAVVAGCLDVSGNAFYALAARSGRLDVAAVLSSLAPAATVLLALLTLKETLSRRQGLGVALALAAVLLIAS